MCDEITWFQGLNNNSVHLLNKLPNIRIFSSNNRGQLQNLLLYWASLDWKIEKWAKFKNQSSSIIFTFLRSFFGWKSKDQKGRVQQKGQGDRHDGIHDPVKFDSFVSITFQPIQNGIFIEQIIYKNLKLNIDKRNDVSFYFYNELCIKTRWPKLL